MREMKDSGIEWIGEIPKDWFTKKIKYNFMVFAGATPKSEKQEYWDGNIVWITPADYKTEDKYVCVGKKNITIEGYKSCGTTIVPKGSIIFSKRAPVGTVAISGNELCTNQGCLSCVPYECVDSEYYYYVLSVFTEQFELLSTGTTFKEISANSFVNFPLPFPTYKEQIQISSFLNIKCTEIDNILIKTRDSIEEYKKLRQAVITQAVTKGLRGDREMKNSGIGWIDEIPEDWEIVKMKNLGKCRNGLTYSPDNLVPKEEGTLVLRSSNIKDGKLSFVDNVYVNSEIKDDLMVKMGDILICSRNGSRALIGKNALIPEGLSASFGAFMMIFRCQAPQYVQMILNSAVFSYYLGTFLTSTINQLTADNFNNMKIVYCGDKFEQKEIVDYLEQKCTEIDTLIAKKEQIIVELENYKKSIIFDYVTGKKEAPQEYKA